MGFLMRLKNFYGCLRLFEMHYKKQLLSSSLVASKCRVTPIKRKLLIPRLELLSNLILSRLILTVEKCVSRRFKEKSLFHVYMCGLILKSRSHGLKQTLKKEFQTFVQNRVVEIRKNISPENWTHCYIQTKSTLPI